MTVIAVIPCWNERESIKGVVERTKKHVSCVIVADDESTDGTALVAKEAGALVCQCRGKHGVGVNTGLGMEIAVSANPDVVLTLDGDGQHNPDEIPQVIEPILKGEADMVIGSRFLRPYRVSFYRKLGIDAITWLYNVGGHQKVVDAQSCFRAFSGDAARVLLPIYDAGFSFSVEMLVKARKRGLRIKEVPIQCIYRNGRIDSSLNPVLHGFGVALGVVKWRVCLGV